VTNTSFALADWRLLLPLRIAITRLEMMVFFWTFILTFAPSLLAQSKSPSSDIKLKIEATELDSRMLLERLNANGAKHHLKFVLAEGDFDYRICIRYGTKTCRHGLW
jgi:hypothetical protein